MLGWTGVISAALLIAIGYRIHYVQSQVRSPRRIYLPIAIYLVFSILLSIQLLSVLHQVGIIEKLNSFIRKCVMNLWGVAGDESKQQAMLSLYPNDVDVVSLATSVFSVGLVVISMASTRLRSDINPYELMDYFPVCIFTYVLIHLLVAVVYISKIDLNYILIVIVAFLTGICITVQIYVYSYHTISHVSSIMCYMLRRVTIKSLRRVHIRHSISHTVFVDAISHVQKWQQTMLQEDKKSAIDIGARCHATAFGKYWEKCKPQLKCSDSEELAYVIGYHALLSIYEVNQVFERKYFHRFVGEYIIQEEADEKKQKKHMLRIHNESDCLAKRFFCYIVNSRRAKQEEKCACRRRYDQIFISGVVVNRFIQQTRLWEAESISKCVGQIASQHIGIWNKDCSLALGDDWQITCKRYEPTYCLLGILVYCSTYMDSEHLKMICEANDLRISADGIRNMPDSDLDIEIAKFISTFDYVDKLVLGSCKHIATIRIIIRDAIGTHLANRQTGGIKYDLPC